MTDWLTTAADLVRRGDPLVAVTVSGVSGSVPREPGAKMLVTMARSIGTIGGGLLEFNALTSARELISADRGSYAFGEFALGPELGQCCGGQVRLIYERLGTDDLGWLESAARRVECGERLAIVRAEVEGELTRRLVDAREAAPMIRVLASQGAFVELLTDTRPRVFVYGAGHVGAAVVGLLGAMPSVVTWIDRRGDFPDGPPNPDLRALLSDKEVELAADAPAGACHLVLTHDHQLDYEIVRALLKRGDFAYCGLIGSSTKRARFERRLRRDGLDDAALARLACPIGAHGLKAKTPAAIALSAVYELFLAHEARSRNAEFLSPPSSRRLPPSAPTLRGGRGGAARQSRNVEGCHDATSTGLYRESGTRRTVPPLPPLGLKEAEGGSAGGDLHAQSRCCDAAFKKDL